MNVAVVTEVLALLEALGRERPTPAAARARAKQLEAGLAGHRVTVLSQEEQFDGRFQHDLLLRRPGQDALYLGYGPADGLPWPLRAVQRWDRTTLLRTNHTTMSVAQAVACLGAWFGDARIQERLVDVCLIEEALEEEPIELDADERREALDAFRRGLGLLDPDDTEAWMASRGMTLDMLERHAIDQARVARLRERVVAPRMAAWLEEHGHRDATLRVFHAAVADAAAAEQAHAARGDYLRAVEELARRGEVRLDVRTLAASADRAFASAEPGDVLPPRRRPDGACWIKVISRERPDALDEERRARAAEEIFRAWLAERRARARVSWNWGTTGETT